MVNLIITAVGPYYINKTLQFLNTTKTEENVHIITDKPLLFKSYNTFPYPFSYFNYFDKFLFGLKIIEDTGIDSYIWDADLLEFFNLQKSKFNINNNIVQIDGFWESGSSLDKHKPEHPDYYNFLTPWLESNSLTKADIPAIKEHWTFWPYADYKLLVSILSDLRFMFESNTRIFNGHKMGFGNGEGIGLGAALTVTRTEYYNIKVDCDT